MKNPFCPKCGSKLEPKEIVQILYDDDVNSSEFDVETKGICPKCNKTYYWLKWCKCVDCGDPYDEEER